MAASLASADDRFQLRVCAAFGILCRALLDRADECVRPYMGNSGIRPAPVRPEIRLVGIALVGAGSDQDFFQAANKFDYAQRFRSEARVSDSPGWRVSGPTRRIRGDRRWVTNDLARPVKCDIATAIAIEEFDSALCQQTSGEAMMFAAVALRPSVITGACSSRRSTSPIFPSFRRATELLLQAESDRVVECAELDDGDHFAIL